jgi:hypothetical protein
MSTLSLFHSPAAITFVTVSARHKPLWSEAKVIAGHADARAVPADAGAKIERLSNLQRAPRINRWSATLLYVIIYFRHRPLTIDADKTLRLNVYYAVHFQSAPLFDFSSTHAQRQAMSKLRKPSNVFSQGWRYWKRLLRRQGLHINSPDIA